MLFDPTIFDNLKVAVENQLYDLDNLDGGIRITDRIDRLEMAVMAREFAIRFELVDSPGVTGEMRLYASLRDLAAEIMEIPGETPGCALSLRFHLRSANVEETCRRVRETLLDIWKPERPPILRISCIYGEEPVIFKVLAELAFDRKINEDQMEDLPALIEHMLLSLRELVGIR